MTKVETWDRAVEAQFRAGAALTSARAKHEECSKLLAAYAAARRKLHLAASELG